MTDNSKLLKTTIVSVIYALLIFLVLSVSTYAWFTSNRSVGTSRVEASVAQTDVSLYVGSTADSVNAAECDIAHINAEGQRAAIKKGEVQIRPSHFTVDIFLL